jgi:hypothetical protein
MTTHATPRRGFPDLNLTPAERLRRASLDVAEAHRAGRPAGEIRHMCPECGDQLPDRTLCPLCQGVGTVPDGVLTVYTAEWNARVARGEVTP